MQKNKINIALITTWYPPTTGIAVNRMQSFVHYLASDFNITVFTLGDTDKKAAGEFGETIYYSSESYINNVLKSNSKDTRFKHYFKTILRVIRGKIVKNSLDSWRKRVLKNMEVKHKEYPFDLVISSFSPADPHLVVLNFLDKNNDVKWIADMRDEMSLNVYNTKQNTEYFAKLEQEINKKATAIISVSQPIVDQFHSLCPNVKYFKEIRNGFDHVIKTEPITYTQKKDFKIGYFGTFYGDNKPHFLMQALETILIKNQFSLEFHIFGAHNNFSIPDALKGKVFLHTRQNYFDAITSMAKMDFNYMPLPTKMPKGVFSGKLFDYLSVQRPVIACMNNDTAAAQLITEFDAGYIAPFDQPLEIANIIERGVKDYQNGISKIATDGDTKSLHRSHQIKNLEKLIHIILGT